MSVAAIVVAAGDGTRFGARKQFALLDGRTVAARAVDSARSVADLVVLVVPADAVADDHGADLVVAGGATRSASVRAGLGALDATTEIVVVHDAARPLASPDLFRAVVDALDPAAGIVAAVPGVRITDTVKRLDEDRREVAATLDRDLLVTVQTPQAFVAESLRAAHAGGAEGTDDASLVESHGGKVRVVEGEPGNRKLTEASDLVAAASALRGDEAALRIGHGHDVHRFSDDPGRALTLGGLVVEGSPGLAGHSDADVATHALCDALLGAAGLGDLGRHFPDDDPAHLNASSTSMLQRCAALCVEAGFSICNADVTIVAQRPKLGPLLDTMAATLTALLAAPVSVKATTTEGLGALGRAEGIAATAVALLRRVRAT